jgi:hypothetical protein
LYIPAKKCILRIDEGPFLFKYFFPLTRGGVSQPLYYHNVPGRGSLSGRLAFMLTPPDSAIYLQGQAPDIPELNCTQHPGRLFWRRPGIEGAEPLA